MIVDQSHRDPELEDRVRQVLGARLRGTLLAFRDVTSTMDVAHELAAAGATEGTLVLALRQTAGRGRMGRRWESPTGGLYVSLVTRPTRPLQETPQLSLVAGLAVAEAVQESTGLHPTLRWPNDVLVQGKKLAGVLVEQRAGAVVLGVGLNLMTVPAEVPDIAISVAAAGAAAQPETICAALYTQLLTWYDRWHREGFAAIRRPLRNRMGIFGTLVQLDTGTERIQGTVADLDDVGRLLVRLDAGQIRAFEFGEVTILR